jgi:DNA invertase Pin-like site-specific DNA recombinase
LALLLFVLDTLPGNRYRVNTNSEAAKLVERLKKKQTDRREKAKPIPLEAKAYGDDSQPYMIGYARVSMADQNPQLQIDALMEHGVHRIYQEAASGAIGINRPALDAALMDLRQGDMLVVWKLDRLGRNTRQVLETFEDLDRRGVRVRVLTQPGMDTSTATGRLIVTIMAAVAELERDFIVERTAAGLKAARARGRIGGRRSIVTDDQVLAASEAYGTAGGARHVGLSKVQFLRRLNKIRELT